MKLISVIYVMVVLVATVSTASLGVDDDHKCGPFQVYHTCGTSCPEHCPKLNLKTGKIEIRKQFCNKMCMPGCFCANGYVRDIKRPNDCIKRDHCPAL